MFYTFFNVIDLRTLTPLFSKEGLGEILWNTIKIPLNDNGAVSAYYNPFYAL
jgi:hypothetical protein